MNALVATEAAIPLATIRIILFPAFPAAVVPITTIIRTRNV